MSETKKKTIGILGGMGPLATADLFQKIVRMTEAQKDGDHIHIFIDNNPSIPDRTAAILHGGEDPTPYMLESLGKLIGCGADCVILPCNTAHYFLPRLRACTDEPILSMPDLTAAACRDRYPGKTAAVLATAGTIQSGLYQKALDAVGVPYLLPDEQEQARLMRVIYEGVKAGRGPDAYREDFAAATESMRSRGADYFILGCTELPLAAQDTGLAAPFIDPTTELARGAILYCGYQVKEET